MRVTLRFLAMPSNRHNAIAEPRRRFDRCRGLDPRSVVIRGLDPRIHFVDRSRRDVFESIRESASFGTRSRIGPLTESRTVLRIRGPDVAMK